jgi:hypothetical protein
MCDGSLHENGFLICHIIMLRAASARRQPRRLHGDAAAAPALWRRCGRSWRNASRASSKVTVQSSDSYSEQSYIGSQTYQNSASPSAFLHESKI